MEHKIALKDTNCALIGSSLDLEARVKAAKTEQEWIGAGKKEGVQVWRVEKFNIKKWKKSRIGTFYDGDSYIILRTYKKNNKLLWNVHFWLGKKSSIDERGVAAYKTVELDDLLGTIPVQYREVQGFESDLFMSYFENRSITVMSGGIASGFRHVEPEKYVPKLFHIKGKRRVQVVEVEKSCSSLNYGDAFVLDHGLRVFVWLPHKAGATEKFRANMLANKIKEQRKDVVVFNLDSDGADVKGSVQEDFWKALGGKKGNIKAPEDVEIDEVFDKMGKECVRCMYSLKEDAKGNLKFNKVCERKLEKKFLTSDGCYIIDVGNEILVWCGKKVPKKVRNMSLIYAQNYIGLHNKPEWVPIGRVCEGRETERFWNCFLSPVAGGGKREIVKKVFPTRTLKLGIVSCSELAKSDVFGKSDPYVIVCCGESEKSTSKLVKKDLNPVFNEKMEIKFTSDISTTCLKIRVFDNDKLSRDDQLGKVDIPLSCLPKGKKIRRNFKLQNAKSGYITLEMTAVDFGVEKREKGKVVLMPTLLVNVNEGYFHVEEGPKVQKPYSPYVTLQIGDKIVSTEVIKKNNKPKFGAMFAFRLDSKNPDEQVLKIKAKNHNPFLLIHKQIGKMMMPISVLPFGKTVHRKIPLFRKDIETQHWVELTFRLVSFGRKNPIHEFY